MKPGFVIYSMVPMVLFKTHHIVTSVCSKYPQRWGDLVMLILIMDILN